MVELLTADGDLVTLAQGDDRFPAAAVSLGGLGVVTALTLRLRPSFSMIQHVHERVPLDAIAADQPSRRWAPTSGRCCS